MIIVIIVIIVLIVFIVIPVIVEIIGILGDVGILANPELVGPPGFSPRHPNPYGPRTRAASPDSLNSI